MPRHWPGWNRVKAIEFAITGKDGEGKDIPHIVEARPNLGSEDISVLLVAVDTKKARSIFTHVNRYAKPTTAGQNYITSDDDILAVIAREITNDVISARLVKYHTNTLTARDPYFTTLTTIYNCNNEIAKSIHPTKIDTTQLPSLEEQKLFRDKIFEVWNALLEGIRVYEIALGDKDESG